MAGHGTIPESFLHKALVNVLLNILRNSQQKTDEMSGRSAETLKSILKLGSMEHQWSHSVSGATGREGKRPLASRDLSSQMQSTRAVSLFPMQGRIWGREGAGIWVLKLENV